MHRHQNLLVLWLDGKKKEDIIDLITPSGTFASLVKEMREDFRRKGQNPNFLYCEDCDTYLDFWKFDYNIRDAGHESCKWRFATTKEAKALVAECKEDDCTNETGDCNNA